MHLIGAELFNKLKPHLECTDTLDKIMKNTKYAKDPMHWNMINDTLSKDEGMTFMYVKYHNSSVYRINFEFEYKLCDYVASKLSIKYRVGLLVENDLKKMLYLNYDMIIDEPGPYMYGISRNKFEELFKLARDNDYEEMKSITLPLVDKCINDIYIIKVEHIKHDSSILSAKFFSIEKEKYQLLRWQNPFIPLHKIFGGDVNSTIKIKFNDLVTSVISDPYEIKFRQLFRNYHQKCDYFERLNDIFTGKILTLIFVITLSLVYVIIIASSKLMKSGLQLF